MSQKTEWDNEGREAGERSRPVVQRGESYNKPQGERRGLTHYINIIHPRAKAHGIPRLYSSLHNVHEYITLYRVQLREGHDTICSPNPFKVAPSFFNATVTYFLNSWIIPTGSL